jgi:hypothetical protein
MSGSGNGQYSSGRSGNFLCGSSSIIVASIGSSTGGVRYFHNPYLNCTSSGSLNHSSISSGVYAGDSIFLSTSVSAHRLYLEVAHFFHISLRIRDTCFFFSKNGVINSSITHRIYLSGCVIFIHCAWYINSYSISECSVSVMRSMCEINDFDVRNFIRCFCYNVLSIWIYMAIASFV